MSYLLETVRNIAQLKLTFILLISAVALLTFKVIYGYLKAISYFKKLNIPGPRPWPLLGNLPYMFKIGNHNLIHALLAKRFGKIYGVFYASEPFTIVTDYNIIKRILIKDFSAFPNRRLPFSFPFKYLNHVLTIARDEDWKRLRNHITPTFTGNQLRTILPIIDDKTTDMMSTLTSCSRKNETVEVSKLFREFSMETILSVAFGVETESKEQKLKLIEAGTEIIGKVQLRTIIHLLSSFTLQVIRKSPFDFDLKYFQRLDRTARGVIQSRRQLNNKNNNTRRDLLHLLMEAAKNGKLSDDEIIAQSVTFLIAGFETTANGMSFTAYSLATNPDVQDKLIDEIDDAFQGETDSFNYDKVQELKYLDMVISETMRLYPSGTVLLREIASDCTIEGYKFKKGGNVMIPVYNIHRDSTQWPDPEKFIPERFTPEEKQKRNPVSYLPFGAGPRMCIGMRLSLMEIKIVLVRILQRMKFTVVKETEIPVKLKVTPILSIPNGIKLGVTMRQ